MSQYTRWEHQMNKVQDRVSQLAVYGFGMDEEQAAELVGQVQGWFDPRYDPPSDEAIDGAIQRLRQMYGRTRRGP